MKGILSGPPFNRFYYNTRAVICGRGKVFAARHVDHSIAVYDSTEHTTHQCTAHIWSLMKNSIVQQSFSCMVSQLTAHLAKAYRWEKIARKGRLLSCCLNGYDLSYNNTVLATYRNDVARSWFIHGFRCGTYIGLGDFVLISS